MKTKTGLFYFLCLTATACGAEVKRRPLPIKGAWLAAQPETSYVSLHFTDNTAVFDNRGDTINRFLYTIDQARRELVLTDPFGEKRTAAILKLTNDSLVFNHLWDFSAVQRFYKSKN